MRHLVLLDVVRLNLVGLGLIACLAVVGTACDDPEEGCPPGMICRAMDGGGGRDAGRVPPGVDAGPLPPGIDGGPPAGCVEAWVCEPWTTDGTSDQATRECVDTAGCGTTVARPALQAALPDLDPEYYECRVEPIVTRTCAQLACHGAERGRAYRLYTRGRLRLGGRSIGPHPRFPCPAVPSETCTSSLDCNCSDIPMLDEERRRSFDAARGFALDPAGTPLADMTQSELLQQPRRGGGFAHAGVHVWAIDDPDARAIVDWLNGARLGRDCNSGH